MKIGDNKYRCDFCANVVTQAVGKIKEAGKKGIASDKVKCLRCGNYISQKTKQEMKQ